MCEAALEARVDWTVTELRGAAGAGRRAAVQSHVLAATHAHADLQAVEPIEPTHPLVIHAPAFPPEQDPEAPVPEARPGVGEIANPQAQRGLIARPAAPIPRGATELREATGPHATDLERHLKPPGELPTAHRPQAFFARPRTA